MVARIVLGLKDGQQGLWISKPGIDVFSAGEEDFLLNSEEALSQPRMSGMTSFVASGGTLTVHHDFGYAPLITYRLVVNSTTPRAVSPIFATSGRFVVNNQIVVTLNDTDFVVENNVGEAAAVVYTLFTRG